MKWIVCGIIALINPIVGVILFVGWWLRDTHWATLHAKEKRLEYNSLFELEDGVVVCFSTMTLKSRARDWDDTSEEFELMRSGQGEWFSKPTRETIAQKIEREKTLPEKLSPDDMLGRMTTKQFKKWSNWSQIHKDYSGQIESKYQIYLRCIP